MREGHLGFPYLGHTFRTGYYHTPRPRCRVDVKTTPARSAAELGYNSILCEDACATFTQRAHDEAMLMHARIFGRVERTEAIMAELEAAI